MKITGLFVALIALLAFAGATGAQDDGLAACTDAELTTARDLVAPEIDMLVSLASMSETMDVKTLTLLQYMTWMDVRGDLPHCSEVVELRMTFGESYTAFVMGVLFEDTETFETFMGEAVARMEVVDELMEGVFDRVGEGG